MARVIAVLVLVLAGGPAAAQRLVEWTEGPGELGLGYPVPIPVDTSEPFDGFRTYAGLHARHQDLMLSLPEVEGFVVGETTGGREIWAYRLGDPDGVTPTGLPESAVMIQGGIHAREWQSPEVVTGLIEWLADNRDDAYLNEYLLDHMNVVVIPVLNIDGFLQTQRFPRSNYIGADPDVPDSWPRDGRMRRKNMLGVDEVLQTVDDHLRGIDLNRNNPPFWATSDRSSSDPRSLVFHGSVPHGQPETQAMAAAAELGPGERLRAYTDAHSFSQFFFSVRTGNTRRDAIQIRMLADFADFHARLPGNKRYLDRPSPAGSGIGSTDEYFATTYQIPSWTLEIEPSDGRQPGLPGEGADYGGLNSNGHDGFILPEREIRRVRENLAQGFLIAYYHQAGPPSLAALRFTDAATGAVVYDAEWDVVDAGTRRLHVDVLQPLEADRDYLAWVAFDKPMRWRDDANQVIPLPGQPIFGNRVSAELLLEGASIPLDTEGLNWLDQPGGAAAGYLRYRDDAFRLPLRIDAATAGLGDAVTDATFDLDTDDMVGLGLDADPATAVDWADGHWIRYENSDGVPGDIGGRDRTLQVPVTAAAQPPPFLIEAGNTAAYFDPGHAGEGFLLEVLEDGRLVIYWFTYGENGEQRWFTGTGEIRGNEAVFEDLLVAEGARFGPAFDPADVRLRPAGRLSLVFAGCDVASMRFATPGRVFRQDLVRLTDLAGLACGGAASTKAARHLTGSWFDPERAGEGFVVESLADGRVFVNWFTYDPQGNQAWLVGEGRLEDGRAVTIDALRPTGGRFGDDFDPAEVTLEPWGTIRLDFECEGASGDYSGPAEFGSGTLSLVRLTQPAGLGACD